MSTIVQSLWIGGRLTNLERLSLTSFLANGHEYRLFVYEDVDGVPDGVKIEDANSVIPERDIFRARDAYTSFANWFRHELVSRTGQFWVDTDVVCLRTFAFAAPIVFGLQDSGQAATGVMRFPKDHFVPRMLAGVCESPNKFMPYDTPRDKRRKLRRKYLQGNRRGKTQWGEAGGPDGFTRALRYHGLLDQAKSFLYFYPIHWSNWPSIFDSTFEDRTHLLEASYCVHLWNEMLNRDGVDKDSTFPSGSLFEQLKRRYL